MINDIEKLVSERVEKFSKLYTDTKFILFALSIVSLLGFLIVYNFLYGYYFSSDITFKISNFSIISNFVPFDARTLAMISFFFICIYYVISGSFSLIRETEKKKIMAFFVIFIVIFLNILLCQFFANDLTIKNMSSFLLLWLFIGLSVLFLYVFIYSFFNLGLALKSFISTTTIFLMLFIILEEITADLIIVLWLFLWLIVSLLMIFYKEKASMIYLICLPISFCLTFVVCIYLKRYIPISLWYFYICIFLLNIVVYKIFRYFSRKKSNNGDLKIEKPKKEVIEVTPKKNTYNINQEKGLVYKALKILFGSLVQKNNSSTKLLVGAALLISFVLIPFLSLICGKGIRTVNISEELPLIISYTNQNGDKESICANYFLENNSILYVSNKNWELEVIKPVNYHIKPINDEKLCMEESSE